MTSGASHRPVSGPESAAPTPAALDGGRCGPYRQCANPGAVHRHPRPDVKRSQWVGLAIGLVAVGVAAVVGTHTLTQGRGPAFQASPSASRITVAVLPQAAFPLSDAQLRAALAVPPNLGPLADPARRAACLAGLGYPTDLEILGGRPLDVSGRPGVLILLPGDAPDQVAAVAVAPSCSAAHAGLLADTVLGRV